MATTSTTYWHYLSLKVTNVYDFYSTEELLTSDLKFPFFFNCTPEMQWSLRCNQLIRLWTHIICMWQENVKCTFLVLCKHLIWYVVSVFILSFFGWFTECVLPLTFRNCQTNQFMVSEKLFFGQTRPHYYDTFPSICAS